MRSRVSLLFLFVISVTMTVGQDFSNKGKSFWLTYPDHVDGNNSAMGIYITSDVNASGTIKVGASTISFTVMANTVTRKFIGPNASGDASNLGIVHTLAEGIQANAGILVTADQPVVVYAHIINAARSGATLALPVNVLGKEYIVPSYSSTGASGLNSGFGQVSVVAPEAATTVEIVTVATSRNGNRAPGDTIRVTLNNPGDVYQIQFMKDADISGTRVRSIASATGACKPIAVFSSTTWSAFDCNSPSGGDNLLQQLFPTKAWGKTFVTAPFITKPYDIIRVFVNEANPRIFKTENGLRTQLTGIAAGRFYEVRSSNPLMIESEGAPISVVQYMTSLSCDTRNPSNCYLTQSCPFPSDPEMVVLNPVEQTINNITVFSARQNWVPAGQSNVNKCYLNIIIKTTEAPSFRINGNAPAGNFAPITGTLFSFLQEDVSVMSQSNPVQNLKADSPFTAIAYGYGSVESYGYNAGTNVKDLSQAIQVDNLLGTVNFPATCRNSPFSMAISLSYQPTQITWRVAEIPLDTTILNPVADSTWIQGGRTLYRYSLRKELRIQRLGSYPVKVTTNNPTLDGCGNFQDIDYDLDVFERPSTAFDFSTTGCFADSVRLLDKTTQTGGRPIIKWIWDLGDGTKSTIPQPAHLFATGGNKTIKLALVTDVGCVSDTAERTVALSARPIPNFTISQPTCEGLPLTITDASQTFGAIVNRWYWGVGAGMVDSVSVGTPRLMSFPTAGTYPVSLALRSSTGCLSTVKATDIVINPKPKAGFILPEVCVNDAVALFRDTSSVAGQNPGVFTYLWGFGPTPVTSVLKNPSFPITAATTYPVSLVVTSAAGCKDTVQQTFTVNGAIPEARFAIVNAGPICSNKDVLLNNTSSVDFGNITRLVIYWNSDNDLVDTTIDESPSPGKTYAHRYPDFGSPTTKTYNIRMVAYSGISCLNEFTQRIVVNASPQLVFDSIPPACQEDSLVRIFSARETSGITGSFLFSGTGMGTGDAFFPGMAGPGTHQIRYTFTTSVGCSAFLERPLVVFPTPQVDAGPDRAVLEGSSIVINATAKGNGLQFLWRPPLGIDDPTKLNPSASPIEDTQYQLRVFSADGCLATDEVWVRVLLKPIVPNTFTPNGDSYNDRWDIRHLEKYPGAIVEVYSTTGQLLFRSVGYNQPWDGRSGGKDQPAGTYYYVIDPKNGRPKIAGYVTILR